jgi:hypothetical protein
MAIMKWNTPPKGHQDDDHDHIVGHGAGVSLVHAVSGDKVGGGAQIDTGNPNYGPATKWSTAPYRGPGVDKPVQYKPEPNPYGYRDVGRAKKCMANDDTCNSWATEGNDWKWCYAHGRSFAKAAEAED